MRIRVLGAAATVAALLPIGVSAVAPASAAGGDGHARYAALAGNDDFLLYAEKVDGSPLDPTSLDNQADIYALGRTGKPIRLGLALRSAEVVSMSRSNVVIVNPFRHHNRLRAWNLESGRHVNVGTNQDVVGATPNGWLSLDRGFDDGTHVVARSYSGAIVDYGDPITPGVDYGVTAGPNGFVAYANNFVNDNGEITYTPWAHPDRHRTLLEPGGKNVRCDSVNAHYAGCVIRGGINRSVALIALSGEHRTTAGNRCAYHVAVWGRRLAWSVGISRHGCKSGHVGATSNAGLSQLSKQRFNILGMVTAWGRVVTSSVGQRSLVKISSIRHHARPLNRANVS
ncbi:MAG TPA: hypothetical protein VHA79_14770 [Mycobacteriales bacterium]|nr:hypothetical protein [Mycobacteriales bacterium]HVX70946.1 hypothetical protein [Mycobacteriales bacterium]